jgi:hypothetical protein
VAPRSYKLYHAILLCIQTQESNWVIIFHLICFYKTGASPSGRLIADLMVIQDVRTCWNYTHATIKTVALQGLCARPPACNNITHAIYSQLMLGYSNETSFGFSYYRKMSGSILLSLNGASHSERSRALRLWTIHWFGGWQVVYECYPQKVNESCLPLHLMMTNNI